MAYKDKEKQKSTLLKYYNEHKEQNLERTRQRRKNNRKFIEEYKSGKKCLFCPENNPICFDFHHLNPEDKDNEITHAVKHWSLTRLQKEIAKCILVCSNCHRKIHAGLITASYGGIEPLHDSVDSRITTPVGL